MPTARQHFFWIDVLRGAAIVLVMFRHLILVAPGYQTDQTSLAYLLYRIGWSGVDLFFVISGCLIGGILFNRIQEKGEFSVGWFYLRRAFRILPAYYFLLMLIYIAPVSIGTPDEAFVPSFFFLQNYVNFIPNIFWYHTWSLCVEEHFYLTFPILVAIMLKKHKLHLFPHVSLLILILSLFARVIQAQYYDTEDLTNFFFTHTRLDEIGLGCAIAYFYTFNRKLFEKILRHRPWVIGISMVCLLPVGSLDISGSQLMKTFGITCNAIGFGGLVILAISAGEPGKFMSILFRPLAKLGIFSYTLYLLHPLMFQLDFFAIFTIPFYRAVSTALTPLIGNNNAFMLAYFLVAVLIAIGYSYVIERPLLYVRNRYFP